MKEKVDVELNQWIVDESTGAKVMYSRLQDVPFCSEHQFNKQHECQKCPFVFMGFRANKHIHKDDGIYDRKTGKKII
jgi:hypothetical protein